MMKSITKETLIPVGLVITIALLSYDIGKSADKMETVENRVHAIEIDRGVENRDYNRFQQEIITRLARIESALEHGK